MKVLKILFLIFVGMICLNGRMDVSAAITLQSQINATPEGGTLHLKKGTYYEPIVLKRDIQVIGEKGVIFKSCYSPNIITIKGENVQLKGVRVESCEEDRSTSAIFVTGRNHRLEDIQIESEIIGIMLQNAENSVFKNNKISRTGINKAFDIWKSPGNTFEGNQIDHVEDGFYMEYSDKNKFIRNVLLSLKYRYIFYLY